MNRLTASQRDIAHILFDLPEATGYALAGGSALVALGVVDRQTRDLDAFAAASAANPPGDVGPLVESFCVALTEHGWDARVIRQHVTFARLVASHDTEAIEIDLAVDSPPLFPVDRVDNIPTLGTRDLAARKVLAILDRAEGRDFTDLWTLCRDLGKSDCIEWAKQLDAGVQEHQIARSFQHLQRLTDDELPCRPDDRPAVRRWFEDWSKTLAERSP